LTALLGVVSAQAKEPLDLLRDPGRDGPRLAQVKPGDAAAALALAAGDKAVVPLFSDGFEGVFPGTTWSITAGSDQQYWGRWSCWSAGGSFSVGSCAAGSEAIACGSSYNNMMETWMSAGPFSLADASYEAAVFQAAVNLNSEEGYDYFVIAASTDGVDYSGDFYSGSIDATLALDLTALLGAPQVWIACVFYSDATLTYANGAQVDDVLVAVETSATPNQAPTVTVTAPDGGETLLAGTTATVTYAASDPDGGPSALTAGIDFSSDGGATWSTLTDGVSASGSYAWSVPVVTTSQGRIRVRVSDGDLTASDISDANFQVMVSTNDMALGAESGVSGTQVSVPLTLANDTLVKAYQLDVIYDAGVVAFTGFQATSRGAGMTTATNIVSGGRVRLVSYFDGSSRLAAGSGEVGRLTFQLVGSGGTSSALTPADAVLSGVEGEELPVALAAGGVTVEAGTAPPVVHVSALRNPGRTRSVQVLVTVLNGADQTPTATAGGTALTLLSLGGGLYAGTLHLADDATTITIQASATNANGTGSGQVQLTY